jgi:DHA3 family macrolide efflux protein-like MFS transporter
MLIGGIVLGLLVGLLAGGRPSNLAGVQFRWVALLFLAVALRYFTEAAISNGFAAVEAARLPLYASAFALLAWWLWLNRWWPGFLVVAAGVVANGFAIVVNGGWMPVWGPALEAAGMTEGDLVTSFHRLLPPTVDLQFLLQAGPLADLVPFPVPILTNVASIGDVFMSLGLAWFAFNAVHPGTRAGPAARERPEDLAAPAGLPTPLSLSIVRAQGLDASRGIGPLVRPETGLAPLVLAPDLAVAAGGAGGGAAAGGGVAAAMPVAKALPALAPGAVALPVPAGLRARVAAHPYARLARDPRFSALWIAQLISLFGDRLHQVALAVLVLGVTGSALQVGLVFLAATLPNLVVGPIAGTFVDRWDQKRVMVLSDVLRAALAIALPFAADANIYLVYPLVFAMTVVSVFFRPARAAVLPRIVRHEDLMPANAAMWTGETIADIAGYPIAGLFVAFVGSALGVAFWLDAGSYVVSAILIGSLTIPPVVRRAGPAVGNALRAFFAEMRDGWRFLRREPALISNTLISAVAQLSIGATLALTVVYARDVLDGRYIPYPQSYAAIDAAIGLGNLVGGFVIGAIGSRWRKGPLVILGYVVMGVATVFLGLTGNVLAALACAGIIGVANMVFIIPTQTLFAERTPEDLMGRVVGIRFSIVFGSLTGAMAVSGIIAESVGVGIVFIAFGAVTAIAGLAGAFIPAVRNA